MNQPLPTSEAGQSWAAQQPQTIRVVFWVQGITITWMIVECVVSVYAASAAHSSALLAFGADSLIELLSASVALLSFIPSFPITKEQAARWSGMLLYVLAAVVAAAGTVSLAYNFQPAVSAHCDAGPQPAQAKDCKSNRQPLTRRRCHAICNLRLPCRHYAVWSRCEFSLSHSLG
jgi:hypothetical protein